MGNCQAIDTETLIIQYPNGKTDRLYWPINAGEIMKMNPGHYIALLISSKICSSEFNNQSNSRNHNSVRLTRIKLLKPTESLVLGQVYRLITTQEVVQGLKAKKEAKLKKYQLGFKSSVAGTLPERGSEVNNNQVMKHERNGQRKSASTASTATKSRAWQPSLQSISEANN